MSRPQGVQSGASAGNSSSAGNRIDASVCARAGSTIERQYASAELSRLRDAGAADESAVTVAARFSNFDGHVAIAGTLTGTLVLTCQRCMKPMNLDLDENFRVILVQEEAELEQEPGGYEAILADPVRLDLLALTEDQALLALPLVPKHASLSCAEVEIAPDEAAAEEGTQRPFGNLRELLRERESK